MPTQPVCTCSDRGTCLQNATSGAFRCSCDNTFTGTSCDLCDFNRYGRDCVECDCKHGACDWGRQGTGKCDCDDGWMGDRCTVSKLAVALGVGIPAAAMVVGGATFGLVRFFRGRQQMVDPTEEPLH